MTNKTLVVQQPLVYPITTMVAPAQPSTPAPLVAGADNPIGQMALTTPPHFNFVLPGLRPGGVAMMVAPGSTGKSYWSLQAALSIACNVDAIGFSEMNHKAKQGEVTYFSFEDDRATLHARINNIYKQWDCFKNQQAIDDMRKFHLENLNNGDMDLMAHHDSPPYQSLLAKCTGQQLVVVDTLSQSHKGEENSTAEMAQLVGNLHRLGRDSGAAFLVLHHASKAAILNGLGTTAEAARGSGTLVANIRIAYYLNTMDEKEGTDMGLQNPENYVGFGTSKQNHIKGLSGLWYAKNPVGVLVPSPLKSGAKFTKKIKQYKPGPKEVTL
jgi:hypothetical protein